MTSTLQTVSSRKPVTPNISNPSSLPTLHASALQTPDIDKMAEQPAQHWKTEANKRMQFVLQSPDMIRRNQERVLKRSSAPFPISLAPLHSRELKRSEDRDRDHKSPRTLKKRLQSEWRECKEEVTLPSPPVLFSLALSQATERRVRLEHGEEKEQHSSVSSAFIIPAWMRKCGDESPSVTSQLILPLRSKPFTTIMPLSRPPVSAIETEKTDLYPSYVSKLEQLPLELFDIGEGDKSGLEWMRFAHEKYGTAGLPARALRFDGKTTSWHPCTVTAYDEKDKEFTIHCDGHIKRVKRLSIIFDDEDEDKFHKRLEQCRILQVECKAIRYYTSFIGRQPSSLFSPIQDKIVQRVLRKISFIHHTLTPAKQRSVDGLIHAMKMDYNISMQHAVVDQMRRTHQLNTLDEQRMPTLPQKKAVPFLAVVETPVHLMPFVAAAQSVLQRHYTKHAEAANVVLCLQKSWQSISSISFFEMDENELVKNSMDAHAEYPMSLNDFVFHQQQHFIKMRERCQSEWRAMLINLIRDNLAGVFNLFVNDQKCFERSELKRYLVMCGFMLRTQLQQLIEDSLILWKNEFAQYCVGKDPALNRIDHYLVEPSAVHLAYVDGSRNKTGPLFVFKMGLQEDQLTVACVPPLDSLYSQLSALLALPDKLASLTVVDSDVVPLMGFPEKSLINELANQQLGTVTQETIELTKSICNENIKLPRELELRYQPFAERLAGVVDVAAHIEQWFPPEMIPTERGGEAASAVSAEALELMRKEIASYFQLIEEISACSPNKVNFYLIRCEASELKKSLIHKCENIIVSFLSRLHQDIRNRRDALAEDVANIKTRLKQPCASIYDMSALTEYLKEVETQGFVQLSSRIASLGVQVDMLMGFQYNLSESEHRLCLGVRRYPSQLKSLITVVKESIKRHGNVFQDQLNDERAVLMVELDNYNTEVDTFVEFGLGSSDQMNQFVAKVEVLGEQLDAADSKVKSFREREQLFGSNPSEYDKLRSVRAKFVPYFELWSTRSAFESNQSVWMTGRFDDLDADTINHDCALWIKNMIRLEKFFTTEDLSKPARVATELRLKLNDFKQYLPFITWLRSPSLRQRHWDKLQTLLVPSKTAGINLSEQPESKVTLAQFLSLNIGSYKAEIEEICSAAQKEYAIELALDKMTKEWKTVNFQLEPYKNTGTHTLKGADDILTLLDDQLQKTQSIKGSPYLKYHENRARKWEGRLQQVSGIMEEWLLCQKTWQYLEPIFSSEDIMRQMPVEGRRFGVVNQYWRKTVEQALRMSNVMDFVNESEGVLKTLQESNKMLDMIGKHLNEYLETKRLAFPRFFFLSNDELLYILSQTKNAQAVQPHLSKCFDSMSSLVFSDSSSNALITAMASAEGEVIAFDNPIDPNEGGKKGNVELWLKDVETAMVASLKSLLFRAMQSYKLNNRQEWILSQPGQVVLAVDSTYWTHEVTEAISAGTAGLQKYLQVLNTQLEGLVDLVRRADLSDLNRLTLGALTVLDVHARDVVYHLIDEKVQYENDFEWLAQMRYYYDASQLDLNVRMVNTSLHYGFEYLGNTTRLVMTPLTDRCYRTLMGAINLHLGGAPEGPAGTGKTETVKDMAKALAQMVVVFNCGDALSFKAMSKFFKGLCCSGAWSCFDEFNRIDLEVLSVVAQQISSIQRAVQEGKHTFIFEGTGIPLVHTCNVFITMNPGYAGRSELPDNLKALFRSVAMMIPDYAMIAEIVLYSYGYSAARLLARKLVACLQLSSEQLSSQDHYDFGMRNVKSILSAAGALRKSFPQEDEQWLTVQAIKNCNEPKFISADLPLFYGIVQDLFPTVEIKTTSRSVLVEALKTSLIRSNMQTPAPFVQKCVELYDTVLVRHGIMVVGQTMSGKSCAIKTVAAATTTLHQEGQVGNFGHVDVAYINPKSVPVNELYGAENAGGEWIQGIVPTEMGAMVQDWQQSKHWKWLVFDGPVDAVWIENMNTVLDDNKKLCLASGEQIKMCPNMTMMFEVEGLAQASPATVSRCGMVYLEPAGLGIETLLNAWLDALPELLRSYTAEIKVLASWLLGPCLQFMRNNCVALLPSCDITKVSNFTKLLSSTLQELIQQVEATNEQKRKDDAASNVDSEEQPAEQSTNSTCVHDDMIATQLSIWVENSVLFCIIWAIGANTDVVGRSKFSEFFSDLILGRNDSAEHGVEVGKEHVHRKSRMPLPTNSTVVDRDFARSVFDFCYVPSKKSWRYWMDDTEPYVVPAGAHFSEIIVPTVDTIRNDLLLHRLLINRFHVLMVGATGTGKTVAAQTKLLKGLDRNVYTPLFLAFSGRTEAGSIQNLIDSKLERRRLGVMGPPANKRCVLFIDDLNMPVLDTYGAQPPIELLRQFMDYSGWYEKKGKTFRSIVDVNVLAAMGPPGGGRNSVTARLTRHFFHVCCNPYDQASLKLIFATILHSWLNQFPNSVSELEHATVEATINAYATIQKELLPTPAKSHYNFNLRDVAKVFQGIMQVDETSLQNGVDLVRLWSHECTRVFCDRLIDQRDVSWFTGLINSHIKDTFVMDPKRVFLLGGAEAQLPAVGVKTLKAGSMFEAQKQNRRQVYADFANPRAIRKSYREIQDLGSLKATAEAALVDYNNVNTGTMNLVLFNEAVDHIARISRIIRQPYGNALLVGVGGSGRQSLTRLAAYIADMELFQVSMTKNYGLVEWKEDLKSLMRKAGQTNKPVVFLFNESQTSSGAFIEDINSILSNGEVPNLFPPEELAPLIESLLPEARKAGKADGNASVFNFFVDRCHANIHVVLCMSPIGSLLRNRFRQFPSIVNCCTIDWFHAWPTEALQQVASHFLQDVSLDEDVKSGVVDLCVDMQERVQSLSSEFLSSLQRYNYVTPTSYLELIKLFRNLFETTRSHILAQEIRYQTGLAKLKDTEIQVKTMQVQLEALKPELIKSSTETEGLIVTIASRSEQVAATRLVVTAEEQECNKQAQEATAIKADCEDRLQEALPVLAQAMNAVRVLKKSALDELKAMKVPTSGVILTIEALCIMMGIEPKKVGNPGAKIDDYWTPAKSKLLSDPQLFAKLQTYDKDHIPAMVIDKVRPYCLNPDFIPAKIAKASQAAEGFCKWVLAMEVYDRVSKQIEPKRQALGEAERKFATATGQLAAKKSQLTEVEALLEDLNTQYNLCNQKKTSLEFQVKECSDRLNRAEKLLGGLSNEKMRWEERVAVLGADFANVVGNILLSSGFVAYLGVFTQSYRNQCIQNWFKLLQTKGIPCDPNFSLSRVLGDSMLIRQWGIWYLPRDSFSIDNAIILTRSMRWGLIIDPQEQASRWIKAMEDEKTHLKVLKQTDDGYTKILASAIQLGIPVLIENVGETLDPILEPLLLRQTFKQGSTIVIRFGGEIMSYHEDFRLYMTSKLPNPHYSPEILTNITLINMMITPEGLEDQMLSAVVAHEEPELEAERSELIVKNGENSRQLALIENKVLEKLNESSGNILDDQDLIETLGKSKQAAKLIEKRVVAAAKAEENINKTRMHYSHVAFSSSNLFFCISDLAQLDPMYQYSLTWFSALFHKAMKDSEKSLDVHVRTMNIERAFLSILYTNVCRSLFEKDKLLFSFMLALRVLQGKKEVAPDELRFLLTGGDSIIQGDADIVNPTTLNPPEDEGQDDDDDELDDTEKTVAPVTSVDGLMSNSDDHWLTDAQWHSLTQLECFLMFKGLTEHISKNQRKWRTLYQSEDPLSMPFPNAFEHLSIFHRLMIVRCFKIEKMVISMQSLVSTVLGSEFISPPVFDLHSTYADSNACTPLIFVLSPGVDVASQVLKLATEMNMIGDKFFSISLGQGQGPLAEVAIREAIDKGSWVLLANCHLLQSWLPSLQKIVDELDPKTTNDKFRLWLTSFPCPQFPVSILQSGVKITNEPPRGIRGNMMQAYRVDDSLLEGCTKGEEFKRFYFGLSFFHAVIQERRSYGPIGFNRYYEFTESDLFICCTQIKQLLDTYSITPYKAMQYLIGELNYGGRVTDDWDRRTLTSILNDFIAPSMLVPEVSIDKQGNYSTPPIGASLADYRAVVADLPAFDSSELFGFNANVSITCAIKDAQNKLSALLALQPKSGNVASSAREDRIAKLAKEIEASLPSPFDTETTSKIFPVSYSESMNTVLVQELVRFNRLLTHVINSVRDVQKALAGTVVMSVELDETCAALYDNAVPKTWAALSYPSLKPLGSWISDLRRRVGMFSSWIADAAPPVYWISGFFFTQSFLTGAMQNYARKHRIPIDECVFDFIVRSDLPSVSSGDVIHPPDDGVYVHGLFLEGARWDGDKGVLAEAHRGQLFCEMPIIHLRPCSLKELSEANNKQIRYTCPVYKTSRRAGTLSTTGHSTNFILSIQLPSDMAVTHWIKRGVALLTQLDE